MYVVYDKLTETMVGPFNEEEPAVQFTLEASSLLNDGGNEFDIFELVEPTQWAFDNLTVEMTTA
jgi:hypothetical protein